MDLWQAAPEAWLYVPNTTARMLDIGEAVELEFDAWPSAAFGTIRATVFAVSPVALAPDEIDVPVPLRTPAFEVKASLGPAAFRAFHAEWPVSPGTAFRARILQHRVPLREWLMRRRRESR